MNKKLFTLFLLGIFLFSLASVSALQWDNVKDYNEETETVYIRNALGLPNWLGGSTIAEVHLTWGDTEVPRGIDTHVGSFTIISYSNVTEDIFNKLDLENLKNGQVMTRGKQYKVKTYKEEDEMITVCTNETSTNGTAYVDCQYIESGNKISVAEWVPISNPHFNFEKGVLYEIGIFVDVEKGDHGDWIPKIMGVSIPEWASFTETGISGIVAYYKMEESSGNLVTEYNSTAYDLVGTPSAYQQTGVIDFGVEGDGTTPDLKTSDDFLTGQADWSMAGWFYFDDFDVHTGLFVHDGAANDIVFIAEPTTAQLKLTTNWGTSNVLAGSTLTAGQWYHLAIVRDKTVANKIYIYINGSEDVSQTDTNSAGGFVGTDGLAVGAYDDGFGSIDGKIDEVGLWERALSAEEITELYNDGDGLQPPFAGGAPAPVVSNENPANDTTTIFNSINLNATVVSALPVLNVSLLINGTVVETDTSGTNNSVYDFDYDLTPGVLNWQIVAFNNESNLGAGEVRRLTTTWANPILTNPLPANNTMYTVPTVNFNATASDDVGIANVSLKIDGVIDQTSSTGLNNTLYSFIKALNAGVHNWSIITYDLYGLSDETETRIVNITIISPTITLIAPDDNIYVTVSSTDFIANVQDNGGIVNVSIYINGTLNETDSSGLNDSNYTFTKNLPDGTITWFIEAVDNEGYPSTSATRTLNTDLNDPLLSTVILTPIIYAVGDNTITTLQATDRFLDTCWYEYNNINNTFACTSGIVQNVSVPSVAGQTTITFFVNDSTGKEVSSVESFVFDTTAPTIEANVTTPIIYNFGDPVRVDFTATDPNNLDTCWYEYGDVSHQVVNSSFFILNENNLFDGNITTATSFGGALNANAYIYINYTKTINSGLILDLIRSESQTGSEAYKYSVPDSCSSYATDLQVRIQENNTVSFGNWALQCYDGSWIDIVSDSPAEFFYEISLEQPFACTSGVEKEVNITSVADATEIIFFANDTLGNINSTTVNFTFDPFAPTILINQPTGLEDYSYVGKDETLNTSITDINLDTCWYEYNNINLTIPCGDNAQLFSLVGSLEITVYANDTVGNTASNTSTWDYRLFELSQSYDELDFVTAFNDFNITFQSQASSILDTKFHYAGTEYESILTVINSSLFSLSATITNDESVVGNNTFYWSLNADGNDIQTRNLTQEVFDINFSLCDAINNVSFLNITFDDELTGAPLDAVIRTSTFNYYLEDPAAAKTYNYETLSNASSYEFCTLPGIITLKNDVSISYFADGYPERTFGSLLTLTNTTTNLVLSLLDDASGLYATFAFVDSISKVGLSLVNVEIYDGTNLVIEKITDSSGRISEWLNPNILYTVNFNRTGYTAGSESHRPIDTNPIIIDMTSSAGEADPVLANGLIVYHYPQGKDLVNDTDYSFGFYASAGEEEISTIRFSIYDEDKNLIFSRSQGAEGNITQQIINTKENRTLTGFYEVYGEDGGYWSYNHKYFVTLITEDRYSLAWFGKSFDNLFPAENRTVLTNLTWWVLWFILMMTAFTFGYNGSYGSSEDARNLTQETRQNTGIALIFAFIVTVVFCYFNFIPMQADINPVLVSKEWVQQWFMAILMTIPLVWEIVSGITKHQRRGH